jgi:hypothetical protein
MTAAVRISNLNIEIIQIYRVFGLGQFSGILKFRKCISETESVSILR